MTPAEQKRTSKFLSLVLRHRPELAQISLDAAGWVEISDLLDGANAAGQRHHVHLSPDVATATTVGKRHGDPVIFEIDTVAMLLDDRTFYQADNGVWLTETVPIAAMRLLDAA